MLKRENPPILLDQEEILGQSSSLSAEFNRWGEKREYEKSYLRRRHDRWSLGTDTCAHALIRQECDGWSSNVYSSSSIDVYTWLDSMVFKGRVLPCPEIEGGRAAAPFILSLGQFGRQKSWKKGAGSSRSRKCSSARRQQLVCLRGIKCRQ